MFADITLIESRGNVALQRAAGASYQQRPAHGLSVHRWPTRSASRPTMRRASSRARAIRTFRRTASTPAPSAARRSSTSGTGSRPGPSYPLPFGTGRRCWPIRVAEQGARRHGSALVFTFQTGRPVHRGAAARHRQQQHRPIQPRVRLQRSARTSAGDTSLRRRRPPTSGSTPPRSRCRRSGRSATADATCLEGPGYSNLNLALVKPIRFGLTTHRLQLRARGVQPAQPRSTSICPTRSSARRRSARSSRQARPADSVGGRAVF